MLNHVTNNLNISGNIEKINDMLEFVMQILIMNVIFIMRTHVNMNFMIGN